MKNSFFFLFMIISLTALGQPKDSITIARQQYLRDQQLQSAICEVLQYMTMDEKVTDKIKFRQAIKIYLDALKQKEEGK